MVHCCIPGCKNTHHHKSKKEEWQLDSRNFSLHDLPGEDRLEVRELWVMAINRSTLPKDVAVCSDHFTEDCFDEKWEEYKRKYGPTKVKRKLKLDAVPTLFPGRVFYHEKVQQIRENWKNKVLQKRLEFERLRLEKEYRDRFKATQTECQCKCRCKLRKKNFGQQVNFQFKFMEDVGVQFPKDLTEAVKDDHSYTQGGKKKNNKTFSTSTSTSASSNNDISLQTEQNDSSPRLESSSSRLGVSIRIENNVTLDNVDEPITGGHADVVNSGDINFDCHSNPSATVVVVPENAHHTNNLNFQMKRKASSVYYGNENFQEKRLKFLNDDDEDDDDDDDFDELS